MTDLNSLGPRLVTFTAGAAGAWKVLSVTPVAGECLPPADRLGVASAPAAESRDAAWSLNGVISNVRYVERREKIELVARKAALGRAEATRAALIPIKKSAAWWEMTQDERREIFETRSRHTAEGLTYLPAIARQLYHARDIGEPFDFLTWFEYAPEHEAAFERLVAFLRAAEEWRHVEREVDIRLIRD